MSHHLARQPAGGPVASRLHLPAVALALGAFASAGLYAHDIAWWYGPVAVAAVHAGMAGMAAVVVARMRHVGPHEGTTGGGLLRHPRLYDAVVTVVTWGRERRLRAAFLDFAGAGPGDAVLDIGCGTGTLLLAAAERVGPTGSLAGVEPAPEMAARARTKTAGRVPPVSVVEAGAERLPFPDGAFDAVLCTLVLHHLAPGQAPAALREMRRVLRPGGRLLLADLQAPRSLAAAMSLVTLLHGGPQASPDGLRDIEGLLAGLGFTDVQRRDLGRGAIGAVTARVPGG